MNRTANAMGMRIGLHHVGRAVRDVTAVTADLAVITGWPVTVADAGESPLCSGRGVGASAMMHGPNGWLEVVGAAEGQPARRGVNVPGVTHSSIQTGNPAAVAARIELAGLDRHPGPVDLGTGFTYQYVRDAEGNVIEVEGAAHAPADLEPWLSHGAIATPDIERLRFAYGALLMSVATKPIHLQHHSEFDRGSELANVDVSVAFVRVPNGAVELWQYEHPAPSAEPVRDYASVGAGHLAFETDDVEATIDRAVGAGFTILDEPMSVDGVHIARLIDPDGNWVELVHYDDPDDPLSIWSRPDPERPSTMDAILAELRS